MGTVIIDMDGVHIKRFYGGKNRGVMYSIQAPYAHLTSKQMKEMVEILQNLDFENDAKEELK